MKRLLFAALALGVHLACMGCAAPRPGGVERRSVEAGGRTMAYRMFIPPGDDTPVPLVVALHRFSEDGETMAAMTGFDAVAEREGFAVVYPDGPGRRFDFTMAECNDAELILRVIDDAGERVPIDRGRVYLTGASNGGFMAFALAQRYPERFAAVAPAMALMGAEPVDEGGAVLPVPVLILYGSADRIVPPDTSRLGGFAVRPMSETIAYWRARNGALSDGVRTRLPDTDPRDGTVTQRTRFDSDPPGAPVVVYRVVRGGHTWPGGREPSPYFLVGRSARDFSASETIWSFFRAHRREVSHP